MTSRPRPSEEIDRPYMHRQSWHREMMRIIRRECGIPFGLPATRWMLEVAAFLHRTEAELIIKSRRVVPGRLLAAGFQFRFPKMEDAVREIEQSIGHSPR